METKDNKGYFLYLALILVFTDHCKFGVLGAQSAAFGEAAQRRIYKKNARDDTGLNEPNSRRLG